MFSFPPPPILTPPLETLRFRFSDPLSICSRLSHYPDFSGTKYFMGFPRESESGVNRRSVREEMEKREWGDF